MADVIYLDACKFGQASLEVLATLHPELQRLFREVIRRVPRHLDFALICGFRDMQAQDLAWASGKSQKQWPDSKHNKNPSDAVDIRPASPFTAHDWEDKVRFGRIVGFIECVAAELGIGIRCGLDWNTDGRSIDERFPDLGHIERRAA